MKLFSFLETMDREQAGLNQAQNQQSQQNQLPNFNQANLGTCNTSTCPPYNGACVGNVCRCAPYKANFPKAQAETCGYERKKQLTAFLLEFFLPFGVGHFYTGVWYLGFIKILLALILPIALCILACFSDFLAKCAFIVNILCPIIIAIWWLVDAILFGINQYKDINGVPLQPW